MFTKSWAYPYTVIGYAFICLDDQAKAEEWLKKAIDAGWRFFRRDLLDLVFKNLHKDERFKKMMAQVRDTVD